MASLHDYSQSLVYKVRNVSKPGILVNDLYATLKLIEAVHQLSGGMKQIVYLVGWQYEGHDSKYPSWAEANHHLKRHNDPDAMASIRWLMQEARQFNAVVSLHINMDDAYVNSPLWVEYLSENVIVVTPDGKLRKCGVWAGEMSYHVCKPREWQAGLGQRRIEQLLASLPIREAGTIHIGGFRPQTEMEHAGITYEMELQTVKDIVDYWRQRDVDVTAEVLADHELVGYHPMVYHYNGGEGTRLKYPATLLCGGGSSNNLRHTNLRTHVQWPGAFSSPEAGCLYEEAWGQSIDRDLRGPSDLERFAEDFYLRTLPWTFLNRHRALSFQQSAELYRVQFSDEVASEVRTADRHLTIRQGDRVLLEGTDVFCPAPWHDKSWICFSKKGGLRTWTRPAEWDSCSRVTVRRLSPEADDCVRVLPLSGSALSLELAAREAVLISPE